MQTLTKVYRRTLLAMPRLPDSPLPPHVHAIRKRVERYATVLDSGIGIPGTRFRIGLESLIGMVPVVGDAIGLLLGGWLILEGSRAGAPPRLLLRMAGNTLLDALAGMVPVVGDLFDFAFKSNRANARLLGAHLDRLEGRPPRSRRWLGALLMVGLLVIVGFAGYGLWTLLRG
jgi:hypothetical protein